MVALRIQVSRETSAAEISNPQASHFLPLKSGDAQAACANPLRTPDPPAATGTLAFKTRSLRLLGTTTTLRHREIQVNTESRNCVSSRCTAISQGSTGASRGQEATSGKESWPDGSARNRVQYHSSSKVLSC